MIIAIANMKGGCGKSTTADMMAAVLVKKGMTVLVVDGDWQEELTRISGLNIKDKTLYDVIVNKVDIEDVVMEKTAHGYSIIPGSMELLELNHVPPTGFLKAALSKIRDRYDYIIIDTPPTPGSLLKDYLEASDCIIVPAQGRMQDSISLKMFANVVEESRQNNNTLYVGGVLQTFYNPDAILNSHIKENLNAGIDVLNTKLFETRILDYRYVDDYATYTNSYAAFVEEFLRDIQPKGADYEK